MIALRETNPNVQQQFLSDLHVIRRSDMFWAGLSADLVIEEVFMRSMKTVGKEKRKDNIVVVSLILLQCYHRRIHEKNRHY